MTTKICRSCQAPKLLTEMPKWSRECADCISEHAFAGTRACFDCSAVRPLAEFVSGTKRCKACRSERDRKRWAEMPPELKARKLETKRAWRVRNAGAVLAENRAYHEKRPDVRRTAALKRASFTPELFSEAVRLQAGRCAICTEPLTELLRTPHADHDHSTGQPRGVLCAHCNNGLGFFRDSPANLAAAIEYLKKSPLSMT